MTDQLFTVLVVQGTVRDERSSIHPARYVTEQFQEKGHNAELFDMKEKNVPLLTEVRYGTSNPHPDIEAFGQKVEAADLIVIVTPEYNHSIPGALKNLLDHLYPEYENKPFAYVSVSGGGFGGVRALNHLHDITLELNAYPGPDLPISNVADVFDEESNLDDEAYEGKFKDFIEQTIKYTKQFL